MKKQILLLFIFLMMLSGKMLSQTVTPQLGPNGLPLYEDGKLYLRLKANSNIVINSKDEILNDNNGNFHALFTKYQVSSTERPFAELNTPALNKTYRISFDQMAKVDSFIIELSQITSDVELGEKVPAVYAFTIPNDPLSVQGSTYSAASYYLALLNANQASSIYTSTGNAVVAIVDDAVLTTHDDLWQNIGTANWDAANLDNNPNPPLSGTNAASNSHFTHGTHVASIAGARTNNGIGIASVGWNNKLMCVKTVSDNASPLSFTKAYDGLNWAATHGAHVINMSWGSYTFSSTDYAVVVAAKNNNIVLVAAAGNDATSQPIYPAAYGEGTTGQSWEVYDKKLVVAVAALDQNNDIGGIGGTWGYHLWGTPYGSNFGDWVDISAYGTNIIGTLANSSAGTPINNNYGSNNGTSLAAPQIAGIAGVMRSYNMSKTANEIIECLIYTANPDIYGSNHPNNPMGNFGSGRANAAAALQCLSSNCAVNPIAIIVPSSPNLCSNITLTLTANQGTGYLWSTGATTQSISVNTPGTYSVTVSYGGVCTATASINFSAPPTLNLTASTNTSICSGYSVTMLSASGNFTALVWQPDGATTNSVVVALGFPFTFTATANPQCGGSTTTIAVNPLNPLPPNNSGVYAVLSPTIGGTFNPLPSYDVGWYFLAADATINGIATFNSADIVIGSNVKLTVPPLNTLNLNGSYLHSCGTYMWKGIEVQNAGILTTSTNVSASGLPKSTIIEDAVTAISSAYNPSMPPPASIQIKHTIFNRNQTAISLIGFSDPNIVLSNVLTVDNSVFSCRNYSIISNIGVMFPPITTIYPIALPMNGVPDIRLRVATSPTTGLASPYLNYFTPAVPILKLPYGYMGKPCGIYLSDVGNTSGNNYQGVVIGDSTNANSFNVFDNLGVGIYAENTNIKLKNNVFQNQKGGFSFKSLPAAAVMHKTTDTRKFQLDMNAANSDFNLGNRFWNCYYGVMGSNVYDLKIRNAIMRSTHTSNTVTPYSQSYSGEYGINLNSNRINFQINNNEFTNISVGISSPITSIGNIPVGGSTISALAVYNNTFSAPAGGFMAMAVHLPCGLSVPPNTASMYTLPAVPGTSVVPAGIAIVNNSISGVWGGINVTGVPFFPAWVAKNYITLVANPLGLAQRGIEMSATGGNITQQQNIWLNHVGGSNAFSADMSLIYGSFNYGPQSPMINCNLVKGAKKGFEFGSYNAYAAGAWGLQWRGNEMEGLNYGMYLRGATDWYGNMYSGIIGTQADATDGMGNEWNGGTWNGASKGIYTDLYSNAVNSPLYRVASSPYDPPNIDYGYYPTSYVVYPPQTSSGNYVCSYTPAAVPQPTGGFPFSLSDDNNALPQYLMNSHLYHFLRYNVEIRNDNTEFNAWYANMAATSNFEQLETTQESLYKGDYQRARDILNRLRAANEIEVNDISYYNLYANYLEVANNKKHDTYYTADDSLALTTMANLCPLIYGTSIYKARALYSSIYNRVIIYDDYCNVDEGGRFAANSQSENQSLTENQSLKQAKNWAVDLYPNPASNVINIVTKGKYESEELHIIIQDLTGRVVYNTTVRTKSFVAGMELNLLNGAYLMTINNNNHESLTRKLLITK